MASLIPTASETLSYPLYACDFDPLDSSRLVVGGGGGAGNNGVGNKITVLDTSNPEKLQQLGEVELPKDEDNVTSLAVGQGKSGTTPVFAGVNSNPLGKKKEHNAHFRAFGIESPTIGKGKGKSAKKDTSKSTIKISEIRRSPLFSGNDKEIYQRITRLSRPYAESLQLAAITNGVSKGTETIVFDAGASPNIRARVTTEKETEDVDILEVADGHFQVAYCTMHDVYIKQISSTADKDEPRIVYTIPFSDSKEKVTVPKFRGLRWLTKDFILMLVNNHSTSGVVLQVLRLPPSGQGRARIVESHLLAGGLLTENLKKATGIAVSNLTPPTSQTEPQGYSQFVIAVAGQDSSITLLKVDLQVEGAVSMVSKIKLFRTFRSVHPMAITSLAFSTFTPRTEVTATTPQQVLKLASVSVQQTVVVHTIPLFPVPLSMQRGQSKTPRYVVALPSNKVKNLILSIFSTAFLGLVAIIIAIVLDIRNGTSSNAFSARVQSYIPIPIQEAIGKPYAFPSGYQVGVKPDFAISKTPDASAEMPTLLSQIVADLKDGVVSIKDTAAEVGGVKVEVHDEGIQGPATGKSWRELSPEQKASWKKKLSEAGHWAEDMGESILKGIVFGELGGAIGRAVAG